jgi:hypothetical protein
MLKIYMRTVQQSTHTTSEGPASRFLITVTGGMDGHAGERESPSGSRCQLTSRNVEVI